MTYQEALITLTGNQVARWTDGEDELAMVVVAPGVVKVSELQNGLVDWSETFTSPHVLSQALSQYDAFEGWTV